jgi:hypothetical protein
MQPKNFNQTRLLANLMTKGVSKSLTRSGRAGQMFCLKCRKPQEPAGRMADFDPSGAFSDS